MIHDPTPDTRNRFAVLVGRILHPFLLPIPTVLAILSDLPLGEALKWSALAIAIVLVPSIVATVFVKRRGYLLHLRRSRDVLYPFGWLCVLVCLIVLRGLNAPLALIACMGALLVWAPLQWAINRWVTKISAHAAVAAGCFTGLLMLGKLANPVILLVLLGLIVLTLWARVVTHNHTHTQVIMGVLVGALPVLVVFPLVL